MTGENFRAFNRHDERLESMLYHLRAKRDVSGMLYNMIRDSENGEAYNAELNRQMDKIHKEIEYLKNDIYCYLVDKFHGNYNIVHEYESNYLW